MKQLLVMLVQRLDHPWWRMRTSEGDPPEEREMHFVLSRLRQVILNKLKKVESENASKPLEEE